MADYTFNENNNDNTNNTNNIPANENTSAGGNTNSSNPNSENVPAAGNQIYPQGQSQQNPSPIQNQNTNSSYSMNNMNTMNTNPQNNTNNPGNGNVPPEPPKQKKPVKPTPIIAAVCAFCIIFSGLAGFGGALLGNHIFGSDNSEQNQASGSTHSSPDETSVIYQSVDVSTSGTNEMNSTATVASAVSNSVVEITTEYQNVSSFFQYVSSGAGSGVIITKDGYIVTNNHVIVNSQNGKIADKISVRLANGETYPAEVIGTDASTDLAVIKIDEKNLTPAIFGDSAKLVVGEEVVAVGNPLGRLGGTVTNGIISALDREIDVESNKMNLLQTNAAVNPGNSGGGLFNMNGELIGIVNAKSSGSNIEGLGFAIPSNDARAIVKQLIDYGYVRGRVYLGIHTIDIPNYETAMYYRVNSTGVYVVSIEEGYNDNVLKSGDRIVAVDGTEVNSNSDIKLLLKNFKVGDKINMSISRDGKLMDVQIECYESVPDNNSVKFEETQKAEKGEH